jgi:hypothetical protein
LFRHVTLSGQIGSFRLNTVITSIVDDELREIQRTFDQSRREFYAETDWALDIRDAKFVTAFSLDGIPSRLVRRNSESQVVVTRERALDPAWRERLSPSNTLWPYMVDQVLLGSDEDRVLVAPMGAPKKKRDALLRELDELRESGVVVPD